jgi:peptidoglycan/LPS O-acetylase OafA/YrhL
VTPSQAGSALAGTEAYTRFIQQRTFGSLDGLRALSIIAVLWHHSPRDLSGPMFAARGFMGVDLFFVVSGFLIVTLLLRERQRTGEISLKGFYYRRFLRIFPPYYLVLAVVAATAWLKPGNNSEAIIRDLPFAFLYVSNMVPMHSLLSITWSLSTEEQFYMVVPALEKYAGRAFSFLLPAAYVIVSLPPFGVFPSLDLPTFFRQTTFGPILLGVMLAHLLNDRRGFALAWRLVGNRWSPIVALGVALLALNHPAADISGWPRLFMHWSMALLLVACVIREDNVLAPVLKLWPLRRIGIVSYGIYLYHMLVWYFVDRAMRRIGLDSQPVFFLANTLGTWLVAETSFRLFESRVLALKDRFHFGTRRLA